MGSFKRFVEVGRVALINYGSDEGKLCVIVDIIDANKCIIEGPETGVHRGKINYRRLSLTDFCLKGLDRGAKYSDVLAKFQEDDVQGKFDASSWGKKRAMKLRRAKLTDFERYHVKVLRKKRSQIKKSLTQDGGSY